MINDLSIYHKHQMSKPWWNKKWGSDKMCSITQTRLRPGRNVKGIKYTSMLKCKHHFYTNALLEWIKNCPNGASKCPLCRTSFTIMDLL